jgi:outer membrane protein TolC
MTRTWSLPLVACAVCAAVVVAVPARAADPGPAASATPADDAVLARPTIRAHQFTLEESLALADRNFPNLWAARARLAYTHAQLEEVRWTPWFQWSANALFGVTPPLVGTVIFPDGTTLNSRNITGLGIGTCSTCLQPAVHFDIGGVVPLYTFGKITSSLEAAEANVRVSEWDMEKARQGMRMDVRRAYFGLQFARDVTYIAKDATDRLDKAITGIKPKGETYAVAALRFLTGVEVGYDVVDEPLKRPDRPLVAVAQYLEAARILRPDVNMARAGVVARRALVDYNRARLYPDIGLTLGASFTSTPSATQQNNLFASDPFNGFGYVGGLGMRWSLDLLPQAARTQQAEAQLEETRALQRLALGNAGLEVEKAYADAVEAKAREEAWEKAEHITKQWIANVQDHIDLGTWNETSLNFPLRSYLNARVQHLQALMDYNVAMSNLAMVSGWDSAAPQGS